MKIKQLKHLIPVEIPTKKYIKAYVHKCLGERAVMDTKHFIGNKLYDLLQHSTNDRKTEFSSRYNCHLKIYVSLRTYKQRGSFLNETNIKNFNLFIETYIKESMYNFFDEKIECLPSFEAHLTEFRNRFGIDIESWSDDSIKKDYYRYRKEKKLPLLYKKNVSRNVPSERVDNLAF